MHQPYTAPTLTSTRPATGLHTSPRQSSHHKPIHQRHSPHTQTPRPYTLHKYHNHTAPHTTRHTASTNTQTHSTQGRPDVDAVDALDVDAVAQTFSPPQAGLQSGLQAGHAVAAPMHSQLTASPQLDRPDRQDQAIQNQTGQDQATHSQLNRPGTRQATYRIRPDQIRPSQTRPNQTRSDIRQAAYRTRRNRNRP